MGSSSSTESSEPQVITQLDARTVENLKLAFQELDTDHNGCISLEELVARNSHGDVKVSDEVMQELTTMFNNMDLNHDNKVSLQEYISFVEKQQEEAAAEMKREEAGDSIDVPSDFAHGSVEMKQGIVFLAQAKPSAGAYVDCPSEYKATFAFAGKPADFVNEHKSEPKLAAQMKNKVKKCPACGKVCAFTLAVCNSCAADISEVPITFSDNIFTSFLYGIKGGNFPFRVSMRDEQADIIVFDDLLALSTCHLNVIPTSNYLPDWRYLLTQPQEGLALLNSMYDACFNVLKNQFWSNEAWKDKTFKGHAEMKDADIKDALAVGFNYPPSQYQLHLQFICMPFVPSHFCAYLHGHHFTKDRFFPIEYARAVLALDIPYDVKEDTPMADIMTFYETKGVSYDEIYAAQYARYGAAHRRLANWDPSDFSGMVVDDSYYAFDEEAPGSATRVEESNVGAIKAADKNMLQNYGRPLDTSGAKPSFHGVYYSQAKQPSEVTSWA